jgi:hypothetical protein
VIVGKCEVIYTNGDKFVGDLKNQVCHGNGIMSKENGDQFTGSWINGYTSGKGEILRANGDRLVGRWVDGLLTKAVKIYYPNGDRFVGQTLGIDSDTGCVFTKIGQGTYNFANGEQYVGDFTQDKRHGKGELTWRTNPNSPEVYNLESSAEILDLSPSPKKIRNTDRYLGDFRDNL